MLGVRAARKGTRPERLPLPAMGRARSRCSRVLPIRSPVGRCGGDGARSSKEPAESCTGNGSRESARSGEIPPGVDSGRALNCAARGKAGNPGGARPATCYVVLTVKEHPSSSGRGRPLFCEVPINLFLRPALGATIEVAHPFRKEKTSPSLPGTPSATTS